MGSEPDSAAPAGVDAKAAELAAMIREIRERVRAANPSSSAHGISLPDLLPLLHARDAAEGKVAAIGGVNPRPPGVVNGLIQSAKRTIARSLHWMVREQVEFNHASVECTEATLNALNDTNRALATLAGEVAAMRSAVGEAKELHAHWLEWRQDWELRLSKAEVLLLRSVGELSKAYEHRAAELLRSFEVRVQAQTAQFRTATEEQHRSFADQLARQSADAAERFQAGMDRVRLEHEGMIHRELRTLRQRALFAPDAPVQPPQAGTFAPVDYTHFAARFRGTAGYVREKQSAYVPLFHGRRAVLDIGCGRGEFLDQLRAAGVGARGIDLDAESVAMCRSNGHEAECADVFAYLPAAADGSLDGIFAAHVIEHLPPERVPELISLCGKKLAAGGVIVLETPNPQCLASLALHFYNDPTHTRPVPAPLLHFYLEEAGFGAIEVRYLSPAVETIPDLAQFPEGVRETLFGGLDYAAIARKTA